MVAIGLSEKLSFMHHFSGVARFCASPVSVVASSPGSGFFSRLRSFTGGFIFASSLSFYVLYFQLSAVTDELREAIGEVKSRQEQLELKFQ